MEAARLAAERLQAADLPADYGLDPAEAQRLGNLAYKWRNYLAAGALGPDLFFLLPDFKAPFGGPILGIADWVLKVWTAVEEHLIDPWEEWMGPIGANNSQVASDLTGGLSQQLAAALDDISGAISNAMQSAITRSTDVFGFLTSGVPQGFGESAFYWSDMLHYRRTYEVPAELYRAARAAELAATNDDERQDAESLQAFALGWMSHCATDVVGHAFTNAKSGGPFRLHWQRHHLVENHFDSAAYSARFGGGPQYSTLGTSALHFRISWRVRNDAPYSGRSDAPAYDYFAGFPPYPSGATAIDSFSRKQHFSMGPSEMPKHLKQALSDTLRVVYARPGDDITPEVLNTTDPAFSDDGRPNEAAMDIMWEIVHRFLAHMGSSGLSLRPPSPPTVINDHPFPTPPGGSSGATRPDRGVDLSDDDVTVLDILFAIFAWVVFIGQVVTWLLTILPALILDVATFPAREILHYTVVAPLQSLVMASRRLLVMAGFISPETEEIDQGLVNLGRSSQFWRASLRADLADPAGFAPLPTSFDEPSGRRTPQEARHADPAYPRDTPRDPVPVLSQILARAGVPPVVPSTGITDPFSEWVFPWRYPERDVQGHRLGWEADLVHAGPFVLGDNASILLSRSPTDVAVAAEYEQARGPKGTEEVSAQRLPQNQHLGHPVDYTLYLAAKLTSGGAVKNFNLDSDRGYAWRCWDWNRHVPEIDPADGSERWECWPNAANMPNQPDAFEHSQPCTPPAQFDPYSVHEHQPRRPALPRPEHMFDPWQRRLIHYLEDDPKDYPRCGLVVDATIPPEQLDAAGVSPEGEG